MISTDELITSASSHYPALGDPSRQTPEEWRFKFDTSPQTKALRLRQKDAAQDHAEWRAFIADLQKALPGHRVRDESHVELDASYAALISVPNDAPYGRLLMVYASFIAPVYLLYELHELVTDSGQFETLTRLDQPSGEVQNAARYIERELPRRFGIERISPEVARIIVPDIAMDNLGPGEVTLADALFSEQRK
ncbi:MAG: hypothetical protein MJE77_38380 [Proteobacteria bacterium]|nr:hypothetical protein [Pseudomonadota bacterium]